MNSAVLKSKILFLKPNVTSNKYGDKQDVTYSDYKEILAGVTNVGGNKNTDNMEFFLSDIIQLQIRYRTDIDESYRLRYKDKIYEIMLPFREIGWHDGLIITANILQ